ncbi:hypothetical protein MF271_22765 (plasmid) [Deinococcus sp. KNUC1210]|uniref:hypothetical protein n=1 Tax=Deinococcus sp. KNUC1210 TaxID=2917691 RepID=UPI001EF125F8|nr:hypothetical protein [Deinococcus sp. KNUC1210]ULH18288.1 hypothetical protein MF271_22765 [Deinococcus sp. KNUC1210]
MTTDEQMLLLQEGDRLAAELARWFAAAPADRLQFVGRTLTTNLVHVFMATIEDVTRRAGKPHRTLLLQDEVGWPEIVIVTADGEIRERLAVMTLLQQAFFSGGRLRTAITAPLQAAVQATSEHLTTRALVSCLKAKPVLDVSRPYLTRFLR